MIPTLQYQCLAAYLRFNALPFCSRNMPSARQKNLNFILLTMGLQFNKRVNDVVCDES